MAVRTYIARDGEIFGETSGGSRKNYLRDALGSVVAVTDSANAKLYSARYKPYGSALTSTGAEPSFTWVGTLGYLKAAGATCSDFSVRARFYLSGTGRWTRVDAIWPFTASFGYANSSPAQSVDPTGNEPVAVAWSGYEPDIDPKKRLPFYNHCGLIASGIRWDGVPNADGVVIQKMHWHDHANPCGSTVSVTQKDDYNAAWWVKATPQGPQLSSSKGAIDKKGAHDYWWQGSGAIGWHITLARESRVKYLTLSQMPSNFFSTFICGGVKGANALLSTQIWPQAGKYFAGSVPAQSWSVTSQCCSGNPKIHCETKVKSRTPTMTFDTYPPPMPPCK